MDLRTHAPINRGSAKDSEWHYPMDCDFFKHFNHAQQNQ